MSPPGVVVRASGQRANTDFLPEQAPPSNGERVRFGDTGEVQDTETERRKNAFASKQTLTGRTKLGDDVEALEAVQGWRTNLHSRASKDALYRMNSSLKYLGDVTRKRRMTLLDRVSAVLVVINMLFMMVEVELEMRSALASEESPVWIWWVNLLFTVAFTVELLMRMHLEQKAFIWGPRVRWNLFDTAVVLAQIADVALTYVSISFVRIFRLFRILRTAKVIKTATNVRELRLMLAALMASFPSLSWAICLIVLVMVVYSMFVMQVVRGHIEEKGVGRVNADLVALYGSLPKSVLTLFMSVTGGADWYDLAFPLKEIHTGYLVTFVFFMAFLLLGMLNILTAVFVESTNTLSGVDADLVIQETMDAEESAFNRLRNLMTLGDTDGSGTITEQEFEQQLQHPKAGVQLKLLDLHVHEARALFRLLDTDGSGEVDISEMLHGMMRLKGTARALDMATMLYENKRLHTVIGRLGLDLETRFSELKDCVVLAGIRQRALHHSLAKGVESSEQGSEAASRAASKQAEVVAGTTSLAMSEVMAGIGDIGNPGPLRDSNAATAVNIDNQGPVYI